eukprot:IDg13004t1
MNSRAQTIREGVGPPGSAYILDHCPKGLTLYPRLKRATIWSSPLRLEKVLHEISLYLDVWDLEILFGFTLLLRCYFPFEANSVYVSKWQCGRVYRLRKKDALEVAFRESKWSAFASITPKLQYDAFVRLAPPLTLSKKVAASSSQSCKRPKRREASRSRKVRLPADVDSSKTT